MLKLAKNLLLSLYMQYELVTCIYMFEPWEKKLINSFVLLTLSLVVFSSFVYLPSYIETFLQFVSPLPREEGPVPYTPMLHTEKISMS
ncbi:PREDICTED: LOW QUALITY PROTEIN: serine palmitoyltransferase small subunit A [Rhagoletis zephyria]|uniref:LOW QUALITY PROTEIN: serine palmitoyltransferase small subunit A n=1 Tax=Rhagoletis zephyria TaxID=28612 RepID=UPI000811A72D|nr:PREDICTED: LOW QUALITY PROTEIN: serine palmitoyltransferase small subunit A [Rhagoletis zephyria]XP_036323940.1 serine palmitoyltransferase small subunit A [Rhagoletis pomonella]